MRDRQHAVHRVVKRERAQGARDARDIEQVAVAEHDPLGVAGRARGVHERAHLAFAVRTAGLGHAVQRQRSHRHRPHRAQSEWNAPGLPRRVPCRLGRDFGEIERAPGTAMVADRIDFAGGKAGVDDHRPRIERCNREEKRDGCRAILADHEHAIASTHARGLKLAAGLAADAGELEVVPRCVTLAQGRRLGDLFRVCGGNLADTSRQGGEDCCAVAQAGARSGQRGLSPRHRAHALASRIMLRAMTSCWTGLVPS